MRGHVLTESVETNKSESRENEILAKVKEEWRFDLQEKTSESIFVFRPLFVFTCFSVCLFSWLNCYEVKTGISTENRERKRLWKSEGFFFLFGSVVSFLSRSVIAFQDWVNPNRTESLLGFTSGFRDISTKNDEGGLKFDIQEMKKKPKASQREDDKREYQVSTESDAKTTTSNETHTSSSFILFSWDKNKTQIKPRKESKEMKKILLLFSLWQQQRTRDRERINDERDDTTKKEEQEDKRRPEIERREETQTRKEEDAAKIGEKMPVFSIP